MLFRWLRKPLNPSIRIVTRIDDAKSEAKFKRAGADEVLALRDVEFSVAQPVANAALVHARDAGDVIFRIEDRDTPTTNELATVLSENASFKDPAA